MTGNAGRTRRSSIGPDETGTDRHSAVGAEGVGATDSGRRVRTERGRAGPAVGGLSVTGLDGEVMHRVQPEVAERLRYLLERLRGAGGIPRRLSLVSALSGEGVTHIARSLGAVLAHDTGHRVCVVDLNWWTPAATPGDAQSLGIADVVFWPNSVGPPREAVGPRSSALVPTDDPNLWFLPAGDLDETHRPAVAHDDRLKMVMAEIAERFDYLVLDLPAVLVTSDSMTLTRLSDQFMLVVRQGATTQAQVQAALDDLVAVPCAGIVLNFTETKIPRIVRRYLGE